MSGPRVLSAETVLDPLPPQIARNIRNVRDEGAVGEAIELVAAAFTNLAEIRSDVGHPWRSYRILYWGEQPGNSLLIQMQGQCPTIAENTFVTGGGGACLFYATYDVEQDELLQFGFFGNR
jgi:hypothetical protein